MKVPHNSGSALQLAVQPKRKVGRPIAFQGDPDDPDLTESERRRIKRRIVSPPGQFMSCTWWCLSHAPGTCLGADTDQATGGVVGPRIGDMLLACLAALPAVSAGKP